MRKIIVLVLLLLLLVFLLILNLLSGSVGIPLTDIVRIFFGEPSEHTAWNFIILESRLPQALTALLAGAGLSVCGLLMQTAFKNPLAGPDVFGISSGAALGVALVLLGSSAFALPIWATRLSVLVAAFVGALLVTGLILFFSVYVRNRVLLLVIGLMVGYLASSLIILLNFFATSEGVKNYAVWGMGSFGAVSLDEVPLFALIILFGLGWSALLIKPLNALLLGDQYAENLGVNTHRLRNQLLLVTGLLTAGVTAYCGPISFIGLAVPHIARLCSSTANHRALLPLCGITGAVVALLCNWLCMLPADGQILPLAAVTPLVGAPVIVAVILRRNQT